MARTVTICTRVGCDCGARFEEGDDGRVAFVMYGERLAADAAFPKSGDVMLVRDFVCWALVNGKLSEEAKAAAVRFLHEHALTEKDKTHGS